MTHTVNILYHMKRLCAYSVIILVSHQAFCYSIRRPDHAPEGTLSLEFNNKEIYTIRRVFGAAPLTIGDNESPEVYSPAMSFALNAATDVSFGGPRYVHGSSQAFLQTYSHLI